MELSPFDLRLLGQGLDYFSRPRVASLLEMLGTNEYERVEAMAGILADSSEDEIDEVVYIFERAMARVVRAQARAQDGGEAQTDRTERPRRRRGQSSAEWREERWRAS